MWTYEESSSSSAQATPDEKEARRRATLARLRAEKSRLKVQEIDDQLEAAEAEYEVERASERRKSSGSRGSKSDGETSERSTRSTRRPRSVSSSSSSLTTDNLLAHNRRSATQKGMLGRVDEYEDLGPNATEEIVREVEYEQQAQDDAQTMGYPEPTLSSSPEQEAQANTQAGEAAKRPLAPSPPPAAWGDPAAGGPGPEHDVSEAVPQPEEKRPKPNPSVEVPSTLPKQERAGSPVTPAAPASGSAAATTSPQPVGSATPPATIPSRRTPPLLPLSGRASPAGSRQSASSRRSSRSPHRRPERPGPSPASSSIKTADDEAFNR